MVFTSCQTLATFNPQITSPHSSQPGNPVNRVQPYCSQEVISHFCHAHKAIVWEKGLLFAISVGRRRTERKRIGKQIELRGKTNSRQSVDNQANNLEEKHELMFFPLPVLEDLGPREHKPMPCSFLFQFQSSHKCPRATPARGKKHYLSRCQHAVVLGGAQELAHETGSLHAATAQQTLLGSAASLCQPSAFPCLSHASMAKCGWRYLILESPQSRQQSWCQAATSLPQDLNSGSPSPGHPEMGTAVTTSIWLVRKWEACFTYRTNIIFKGGDKIMKCASIQLKFKFFFFF